MRFGHWLCLLLADAADTIDVDTVAGVAGDIFADALIRVGVPGWAASVIGWGVSNAAQKALVHVMPGAQLCLGLRVLSVLVCPKPEKCPASDQLAGPLLKALLDGTESS